MEHLGTPPQHFSPHPCSYITHHHPGPVIRQCVNRQGAPTLVLAQLGPVRLHHLPRALSGSPVPTLHGPLGGPSRALASILTWKKETESCVLGVQSEGPRAGPVHLLCRGPNPMPPLPLRTLPGRKQPTCTDQAPLHALCSCNTFSPHHSPPQ